MKKLFITAAALAAITAAAPATAQSAVGAPTKATANARLIKPLTLTRNDDLNFGTIVMGTLTGDEVVSISTAGAISCGTSGALTCAPTGVPARYTVTGTQGQVVTISSAPSYTLTNGLTGTLNFVPSFTSSLTLGNSGSPGNSFNVGGSITIGTATEDGVYAGEIDIQVAYQ